MSSRPSRNNRRLLVVMLAAALIAGACSSDSADSGAASNDLAGDERCAVNEAAGTITYISSFDFAAAASILDVIAAEAEGYFDDVCLDVEIVSGFAPGNGALVAAGQGQFSSAGSFGELVNNNVQGELDLVAVGQYGKTGIEALVVPADSGIVDLADMTGATVGIKGDLPYSIQSMLGRAGVSRSSLDELLLDGFDPVAHLDLGIDALPVYKSNEPAQLAAAGVDVRVFDPLEQDVPASFAVFFTTQSYLDANPTVVEDFLRAAFKGFEFALANPGAAVAHSIALIDAAGNPNFLFIDGETFRWSVESELVVDTTAEDEGPGLLAVERLGSEIDTLTEVGVFDETPDWQSMIAPDVAEGLYDGTTLIWPSP